MHKRSLRAACLCVLLCVPALLAQQSASLPVNIRVTDQSGAAIPRAQIRLVPPPETAPAKLETDDHGQLSVSVKAAAIASLFLPRFTKDTRHIDIGQGS